MPSSAPSGHLLPQAGEGTSQNPFAHMREKNGTLEIPSTQAGEGTLQILRPQAGEGTSQIPSPSKRETIEIPSPPRSGEKVAVISNAKSLTDEGQN